MVNNNIKDIKITAFYKIFKLSQEDANTLLIDIKNLMSSNNIKGTVLLGYNEGINGTVAGSHDGIRAFHNFFNNHTVLKNTGFKQSYHDSNPFDKIKVISKNTKSDESESFTPKAKAEPKTAKQVIASMEDNSDLPF